MNCQRRIGAFIYALVLCLSTGTLAQSPPPEASPSEAGPAAASKRAPATPAPSEKAPPALIQILQSADEAPYREALQGFRRELEDLLGAEGEAFRLRVHILHSHDPSAETVPGHESAQLIFALGTAGTQVAKRIAGGRPIVFSMVVNPITQGIYTPSSPGSLTGVTMDVAFEDQFEALKRVLPNARRVGVLHQKSNSPLVERARQAASEHGLSLEGVPVESSDQIPAALEQLTGKIDALWSFADSVTYSPSLAQFLILHTLRTRMPFMGVSPGFVKAGALFCVYASYEDVGSQSAEIVGRVLAGQKIRDIPLQHPRRPKLALNLTAAEAIGQVIPLEMRKKADLRF